MFRKQKPYTEEWQLYEQGKEYHYSIGLYDKVNTNERFYRGDQWEGIQSGGLPTPVFNIFRRIIDFFTSSVLAGAVKLRFSADTPGETRDGKAESRTTEKLNRIADFRWDKQKMDALLASALRDAAITGDAVCYTYWDPSVRTGQPYTGDFVSVLVDNTNVFFGNFNCRQNGKNFKQTDFHFQKILCLLSCPFTKLRPQFLQCILHPCQTRIDGTFLYRCYFTERDIFLPQQKYLFHFRRQCLYRIFNRTIQLRLLQFFFRGR